MKIAVTGGLGFIGSAVIRHLLSDAAKPETTGLSYPSTEVAPGEYEVGRRGDDPAPIQVLNIDAETYAATHGSVASVAGSDRYRHAAVDITDRQALDALIDDFEPDAIIHLAAESHVDRSIDGPGAFIETNVNGTYHLLEAARRTAEKRNMVGQFRFVHVSTDEVFGSLPLDGEPFNESTRYDPRSPYSASKAASDHLVRAWHETYGLPTIVTNCSNNYGPYHFPEKLIPLMILKAAAGEPLPVYGRGDQIRDWLYVGDHARGIVSALLMGEPGHTYLFGGNAERKNVEVVEAICDLIDVELGSSADEEIGTRRELISFVADRPGHDLRYAVDTSKAAAELGWEPSMSFEEGLAYTVRWFFDNEWWWKPLVGERYAGQRLGISPEKVVAS